MILEGIADVLTIGAANAASSLIVGWTAWVCCLCVRDEYSAARE